MRTNNFSTSNLSRVVGSQIESTVYQFPGIDGIEFQVAGRLDVQFRDERQTSVQVCVVHPDPSLGVLVSTCGDDKYEASEATGGLAYQVRQIESEYFRDDAAIALAGINPSSLSVGLGDSGEAVALAQRGLEAFCLHVAEEADGVHGPATHERLLREAVDNTPSNEECFA